MACMNCIKEISQKLAFLDKDPDNYREYMTVKRKKVVRIRQYKTVVWDKIIKIINKKCKDCV